MGELHVARQPRSCGVVASYLMTEPTQMVRIRDAVPGDGDALAELHARSRAVYYAAGGHDVAALPDEQYRETWRKMVNDPQVTVLVAVLDDDIVGVITLDANGAFPANAPHETRVRPDDGTVIRGYRLMIENTSEDAWLLMAKMRRCYT